VPVSPAERSVTGWREALAEIRSRSTDMQIAIGDLERASAQGRIALAGALPSLTGQANVTDDALRATTNPLNGSVKDLKLFPPNAISVGASLSLTVPLFAPRAWYATQTAEMNMGAARLAIADVRRQVVVALASALVGVVTADKVSELNRVQLRSALERLELTKRRVALGAATASALDVLRAEQDVNSARAAIVTGDEALRQARESLGLALGFPSGMGVSRDVDLDTLAHDVERMCHREADVTNRPDLLAAREKARVASRAVNDVYLQFVPTINLVSQFSVINKPFVSSYNLPAPTLADPNATASVNVSTRNTIPAWSIAAVLNWNIWDGGVRYGNLRDTRAQVSQAEAKLEAARRNAVIEVDRAQRGVSVAENARVLAEEAVQIARDTDRLTRLSFMLGRGTSLELVDAARSLRQAEVQLTQRQLDAFQSKLSAYLALTSCDE
jgi:outer membrane protein TolC